MISLSVSYGITAARNPVYLAGQTSPTRVTKEAVEVNMTLRGDNIGEFLLVRCDGHFMDWKNQIVSRQYDVYSFFES